MSVQKSQSKVPVKMVKRFLKRGQAQSLERLLVELITNSTDSYKRLRWHEKEASGRIQVTCEVLRNGETKIEVKDEAEGISFRKLKTVSTKYGKDTSGLSEGAPVRGTIGVGLKDVCLLMRNPQIITIYNSNISECTYTWEDDEPYASYPREGELVSEREREKLGLRGNGTIVKGILPKDPRHIFDFKSLHTRLSQHYMLRRINQLPELYQITLKDRKNQKILRDVPPKGKPRLEKTFYVPYDGVNFKIKLQIKKADKPLGQTGEFRKGGLIVVYNKDAVAACSLFNFDLNQYAKNLYGEVEILAENYKIKKLFKPEITIIDAKRRMGLDPDHPFVQQLISEIRRVLKSIIEEEKKAKKKLEESVIRNKAALQNVLRVFNTMAKKELREKKDVVIFPPSPYWTTPDPPNFFKFYYESIDILEYQTTIVGMGILSDVVPDGSQIKLTCSDPTIEVTPKIVLIDSAKAANGLIKQRITLLGKRKGIRAKISAEHGSITDEMMVNVVANPLLRPKDGFAFVPNFATIPEGKKKKVDLVIILSLIKESEKNMITFSSSNPDIHSPHQMMILPGLNIIGDKVLRMSVPLKGDKAREKGTVVASFKQNQAILNVTVTKKREQKGMFSGFKCSRDDVAPLISDYDPETGIITIYILHPMYRKHVEIGIAELKVFVRDVIIRTACESIVTEGIRRGSARFPILSETIGDAVGRAQFLAEVRHNVEMRYHQYGARLLEYLRRVRLNTPLT